MKLDTVLQIQTDISYILRPGSLFWVWTYQWRNLTNRQTRTQHIDQKLHCANLHHHCLWFGGVTFLSLTSWVYCLVNTISIVGIRVKSENGQKYIHAHRILGLQYQFFLGWLVALLASLESTVVRADRPYNIWSTSTPSSLWNFFFFKMMTQNTDGWYG